MTALVAAGGDPPPAHAIARAVEALRAGDVVAIPTDTVYGLAVDPNHPGATARLFAVKGRPRGVDLPVLVADEDQALRLAGEVSPLARRLMARWWPGPLTLVVARRPDLGMDLGERHDTIGVRCPDHPVPRGICAALGPIATSSANRHGQPPLTTAEAVVASLGDTVDLVLDGGPCERPPSTVVEVIGTPPRLLRAGALAWADMADLLD
jgi:tRNA threonylcarbamoyl adenosine modification protein (Sua5/YciO/YrdC/YwlC family)